jgi:rRNA maturation RNase YbeY
MIETVNRQRKTQIDCEHWQRFVENAWSKLPTDASGVTVAFVSDVAMRALNRRWRQKQGTTDVLSFPAGDDAFEKSNLGDVVISVEQAARQAKANGLSLEQEIAQLILHGLLHLCGYDHATDSGEMDRLELRLRKKLGVA